MNDPLEPSLYDDAFAREALPARELWPQFEYDETRRHYPRRLNAAVELLDGAIARGFGPLPCLRAREFTWTYADLLEKANRLADVLTRRYGLRSGQRVLLRGANSPMLAACWFGVLKAGGIAVTTMPLLRSRELAKILRTADIGLALCEASLGAELEAARAACPSLQAIGYYHSREPDGLEARMAGADAAFENVIPSRDDVALIAFTSGTTGKPKATMHFHRDVLSICDTVPEAVLRSTPADIVTGSAPLGFTYGLGSLLLFPIRRGASSVLLERASAEVLLRTIRDFRVTTLMIGPTLYRSLLALIEPGDVASLRLCCSSGEHLPAALYQAWRAKTGLSIRNLLGSTEMLHAFAAAAERDPPPGSLGTALPGYRVEVFDDAMRPAPAGAVGRLGVRGPTGCRYLRDDDQQRAYVVDGWNLTGDAFLRDENGVIWHQGRVDEIIVSSGYNISGAEVEAALMEHPGVAICAVVGAPDAARGALVKAFVVPASPEKAGPELARALQDHVKSVLAPYKYPRAIEFVEQLPLTETGKIQRSVLRRLANGGTELL